MKFRIISHAGVVTAILIVATASPMASAHAQDAYPTIDNSTQKSRDDARGQILQNELATERKAKDQATAALAAAVASKQPQDKITAIEQGVIDHEKNIEAIQAELDGSAKEPASKAPVVLRPVSVDSDSRPVPYWDVYRRPQVAPDQAPASAVSAAKPAQPGQPALPASKVATTD